MDIVCLSTTDWDEIWGSRQQIMSGLAINDHRILFVERQVSLEQILRAPAILRRKIKTWSSRKGLKQIQENLWTFNPPLVPPGRYYSHALNNAGQRKIADSLTKPLSNLGFKEFVLWIYPPHSAPVIPHLPSKMVVYHCIDYFAAGQKGKKREIIRQQEYQLLSSVDQIFVNSKGLLTEFKKSTNRPIALLPSAVNATHFQKSETIHPDLDRIPHPRLGFSGTIDARVDSGLIEKIAITKPGWQIILLGDQRPGFRNSSKLHSIQNVHFLGKKAYSELPLWLNGFDVCLIPYVQDERTFYISPLKFYEYLAVGKPIVSVPMPELVDFNTLCSFARSPDAFINAIEGWFFS